MSFSVSHLPPHGCVATFDLMKGVQHMMIIATPNLSKWVLHIMIIATLNLSKCMLHIMMIATLCLSKVCAAHNDHGHSLSIKVYAALIDNSHS